MPRVHVEQIVGQPASTAQVEIVERKGLGHPDTICDSIGEQISRELSQLYLQQFGRILHHNCDKAFLAAGRVEHRLGGGEVLEPMRLILGDRATSQFQGTSIDIPEIATRAARSWLRENLPALDPDRDVVIQSEIRPGSEELSAIFEETRILGANDTSAAVGYAPMTETERIVLQTERWLNRPGPEDLLDQTGQDVKVMGIRIGRHLQITIAMPLFDRFIRSPTDYWDHKTKVEERLLRQVAEWTSQISTLSLSLNHLDSLEKGLEGMYLTVLGTSAESADSGQIGRGNRANGLICFNRPGGMEATAGKNPVSHVGKIYNVLAYRLADQIQSEIAGIQETIVKLCSRIGDPIDQPAVISVQVELASGASLSAVTPRIQALIDEEFSDLPAFCRRLALGDFPVC